MTTASVESWGPLATQIHDDVAQAGDPTWKDNAFVAFWDLGSETFGSVHVSTSPNKPASRRARCSLSIGGKTSEVIEELPRGSFAGKSINFGLDGVVRVEHPDLSAEFVSTPLFAAADYSSTGLLPELVGGQPLQHFESACEVRGEVLVDGVHHQISGRGFRDRSWGFRDESASFLEYVLVTAVSDDVYLTAMKFLRPDSTMAAEGFWVTETDVTPVVDLRLRRNAAAQFVSAHVELASGEVRDIAILRRLGGFFVPMGVETDGPTFGAYDDFVSLRSNALTGAGMVEQGVLHRVH
jgi:hypothetical protein